MELQIMDILDYTTVDGPGFRTSIYCAGCHHACPGCHNPQSWNPKAGNSMTVDAIMEVVRRNPFKGVTFTGGDPLYQLRGFTELAGRIKAETDKDIWCFTGFRWEELTAPATGPFPSGERVTTEDIKAFLSLIDVLVDGPFVMNLRDEDLLFRGSGNQRLIDVKKSLEQGVVALWERNL